MTRRTQRSSWSRCLAIVDLRRDLEHDQTRANGITVALKAYIPQDLSWSSDKEAAVFAALLERWPTLEQGQRARSEALRSFVHTANVRRAKRSVKRHLSLRSASGRELGGPA
jgi:hypothetical protein